MSELDIPSFNIDAIYSIRNNPKASVGKTYEDLRWHDDNDEAKPTKKEFDDAVAVCKAEWDAQEYARNRATAYPSTGDQLDMIYKDMKNSTTTHADAVEVVKTKYPKG
jgi:hypothetical protein